MEKSRKSLRFYENILKAEDLMIQEIVSQSRLTRIGSFDDLPLNKRRKLLDHDSKCISSSTEFKDSKALKYELLKGKSPRLFVLHQLGYNFNIYPG